MPNPRHVPADARSARSLEGARGGRNRGCRARAGALFGSVSGAALLFGATAAANAQVCPAAVDGGAVTCTLSAGATTDPVVVIVATDADGTTYEIDNQLEGLTVDPAFSEVVMDLEVNGDDGDSASVDGIDGGVVTIRNTGAGTLFLTHDGSDQGSYDPNVLYGVRAVAFGGDGGTPGSTGDGGRGGDGGYVTIVNAMPIRVDGSAAEGVSGSPRVAAVYGESTAGAGGAKNDGVGDQNGGNSGDAKAVTIDNTATVEIGADGAPFAGADYAWGIGVEGKGNEGAWDDGEGGTGADVLVEGTNDVSVYWNGQDDARNGVRALYVQSRGGDGYASLGNNDSGGDGEAGKSIDVTVDGDLTVDVTAGTTPALDGDGPSALVYAISRGGDGGEGPSRPDSGVRAGDGGGSAVAGEGDPNWTSPPQSLVLVTMTDGAAATASGDNVLGIVARALGGTGGSGDTSSDDDEKNSDGGDGGRGGGVQVTIENGASVTTTGANGYGVLGQSVGGLGGAGTGGGDAGGGGDASAIGYFGASGTAIATGGDFAAGAVFHSVGGGGGVGGDFTGVLAGSGGTGGNGGDGGGVILQSGSAVTTSGDHAYGLLAQSIGGSGGSGGIGAGLALGLGGDGGDGGAAGVAEIDNTGAVTTAGYGASGLLAQSIAGGGGAAGVSGGTLSVGGEAGAGANDAGALVTNAADVSTGGDAAIGILAQGIGGGGGTAAGSAGLFSVGGSGATGGTGGTARVWHVGGTVATSGDFSHGIMAQSVGGGGGTGGDVLDLSVGVGFGVGGGGGTGGAGGAVCVANLYTASDGDSVCGALPPATDRAAPVSSDGSAVRTRGDFAVGVLAQSVGGGGGNGGTATGLAAADVASFQIGGSSSGGGAGGDVIVAFSDFDADTFGSNAPAILAHSVGGGGGNGGSAVSASAGDLAPVQVGGSGSGGGAGGKVEVGIHGSVVHARGAHSAGIIAQSIGGGGGTGGASAGYDASVGLALVTSVGGAGGKGGNGGAAEVSLDDDAAVYSGVFFDLANSGLPTPVPGVSDSHGVVAQSIGGGGGIGGTATADAVTLAVPTGEDVSFAATITTTVGGAGGTGGDADDAYVGIMEKASVLAGGTGSFGILAQSIAGGGGAGGSASALSGTIGDANTVSTDVSTALGASGASGGTAGRASIVILAEADLITYGDYGNALVAQSIGGGGGNGGVGSAANDQIGGGFDASVSIGLGGSGGDGGTAGQAEVFLEGATRIATSGSGARAILAQSIGGGGGASQGGTIGLSASGSVGGGGEEDEDDDPLSAAVTVNVGASGASGASGGPVDVTVGGQVSTAGGDADGILAQSIGGSGGLGGSAGADAGGGDGFLGGDEDTDYRFTLSIGGSGGTGGDGGETYVSSSGTIETMGDHADGIVAQSVGGGGGTGGTSAAAGSEATVALSLAVGGAGGAAGDGGAVVASFQHGDDGGVTTQGVMAHGVVLQSIGGGGGQGADGSTSADASSSADDPDSGFTGGMAVGGSGRSSGDGGTISLETDVAQHVVAATSRHDSHGFVAQSIGGGGGIAGAGSAGAADDDGSHTLDVSVGGTGGAGGDGGAITLDFEADLTTGGRRAIGLLAQSIGGGGGIGGAASAGELASIRLGGTGGSAGNAGKVAITLEGGSSVMTSGRGAHGILAQSIGGGGGLVGDAGAGPLSTSIPTAIISSAGNDGAGGDVSVTVASGAEVRTIGDYAFAVVAQSLGGGGGFGGDSSGLFAGSAFGGGVGTGTVDVTVDGTVSAFATGAVGVFAQSQAFDNNETVTVNVSGAVTGGTGSDGVAVFVSAGVDNVVDIAAGGSVKAGASNAYAIRFVGDFGAAEGSVTNVVNAGTIDGQVSLLDANGDAAGSVTNQDGGTWQNPGATVVADVSNAGSFRLGRRSGAGARLAGTSARTTRIAGDYVQTAGGVLRVGVDFAGRTGDRLVVDGDADVSGLIAIDTLSLAPGVAVPVVSANGAFVADAEAVDTAAVDFRIEAAAAELRVAVGDTDFGGGVPGLDANAAATGRHLDAIFAAGGGAYGELFGALNQLAAAGDFSGYEAALDSMSPGASSAIAAAQPTTGRSRLDRMMSCPTFSTDDAMLTENTCVWAQAGANAIDQETTAGTPGYAGNVWSIAGGGQFEVREAWFAGLSAAYENGRLDGAGGRTRSQGESGSIAASLKYDAGGAQIAAALAAAWGSYDITRRVAVPGFRGTARGTSEVASFGGRLRAGYTFAGPAAYVRPFIDLDVVHTDAGGYTETGAGIFGLAVADASQTVASATPAVEVGARIELRGPWLARAFARGGVTVASTDSFTTTSRLAGAPASVGGFDTTVPMADVLARLGAGLQVSNGGAFDLRGEYDGAFGEGFASHGGMLRLVRRF